MGSLHFNESCYSYYVQYQANRKKERTSAAELGLSAEQQFTLRHLKKEKEEEEEASGAVRMYGRYGIRTEGKTDAERLLQRVDELKEFKCLYGHCNVPSKYENKSLAIWTRNVTTKRDRWDRLPAIIKEQLLEMGLAPKHLRSKGEYEQEDGEKHRREEEKLIYEEDKEQKEEEEKRMESSQISEQEEVTENREEPEEHFEVKFVVGTDSFYERLKELKKYKKRFGNCLVPRGWAENMKLANWVRNCRTRKRWQSLSSDKQKELLAIGFKPIHLANDASPVQETEIKERDDESTFIKKRERNEEEHTWMNHNGQQSKRQKVTDESSEDTEKSDEKKLSFLEERIADLRSFKNRFGHCKVPQKWSENKKLGCWVSHIRYCQDRWERLSEEHKRELSQLGLRPKYLEEGYSKEDHNNNSFFEDGDYEDDSKSSQEQSEEKDDSDIDENVDEEESEEHDGGSDIHHLLSLPGEVSLGLVFFMWLCIPYFFIDLIRC